MLQMKRKMIEQIIKRRVRFVCLQNTILLHRCLGSKVKLERSTSIKTIEKNITLHPIIKMEGKYLIQFFNKSRAEKELMPYYRSLFKKALEEERYYYKTRPSMTGKLLYGLIGNRSTLKLLTRFYFGTLQRNDLLAYSDNSSKDHTGFLIHVLKDNHNNISIDHTIKKEFNSVKEVETRVNRETLFQPYPVVEQSLSKEQMRSVVENVYQEIEKKIKREQIRKGRS